MKTIRLLLVSLVCANTFSRQTGPLEIICPKSTNTLDKNHRAYSLLASLTAQAGYKAPIIICSKRKGIKRLSEMEICCYPWYTRVITATEYTLNQFPEPSLKGLLAHELGHVYTFKPYYKEGVNQNMADAFALQLVGEEVLKKAYISHTSYKLEKNKLMFARVRIALGKRMGVKMGIFRKETHAWVSTPKRKK